MFHFQDFHVGLDEKDWPSGCDEIIWFWPNGGEKPASMLLLDGSEFHLL